MPPPSLRRQLNGAPLVSTKEPTYRSTAFICPHCQAYAHQKWWDLQAWNMTNGQRTGGIHVNDASVCYCERCNAYSLWVEKKLIYPPNSTATNPASDMPDDVAADFQEARSVFDRSPRSAAALLRLGLQKLMPHLGEKGKNIDDDIKSLVQKGLPIEVQRALDTVRVIGNNAVHPGQIDLDDNKEMAASLFGLLNFIVERMITQPKQLGLLYQALPQSSREAIDRRDGRGQP